MINIKRIKENYSGFRVFGDVHGEFDQLIDIVREGQNANLFPIGLGDYTDRGPKSPEVMEYFMRMVRNGQMYGIIGNHDDKLWRYLNGNGVKIGNGLEMTVAQLETYVDGKDTADDWYKFMPDIPLFFSFDTYTFVHGAFHPAMLNVPGVAYKDKKGWGKIVSRAMYGQVDGFLENGFPNRIHDWVDTIPPGHTAFVGHEVIGDEVLTKTGANGGTAVFIDTGAGKGGHLSFVDVTF